MLCFFNSCCLLWPFSCILKEDTFFWIFRSCLFSFCLAGYENVHEASHLAFWDKIRGKIFVLCMQNLSTAPEKPLMPDLHLGAQRKMPVKSWKKSSTCIWKSIRQGVEAAVTESMWKADERGDAFDGVAMCWGDRTQFLGYGMKTAQRRSPCLGIRCW